jgi:hypothetical protein
MVLFFSPISDDELEITASHKKVHYKDMKFKKDQMYSVSLAWINKTMQVIPDVEQYVGKKCTIIDNRHAADFKSVIAYPVIDTENREATRDSILGILQIYANEKNIFSEADRDKEFYQLILDSFSERIKYEVLRKSFKSNLKKMKECFNGR